MNEIKKISEPEKIIKPPVNTKPLKPNEAAFVKEYINNGFNALRAYETVHKCAFSTANANSSNFLKRPRVYEAVMNQLTDGIGFNEDYVKTEMIKRAKDKTRSENSQDKNLDNVAKIIGVYKNESNTEKKVLNVTNVLNVMNTYSSKEISCENIVNEAASETDVREVAHEAEILGVSPKIPESPDE